MDFELSDEHKLFRDTVHDFAQEVVAPGASSATRRTSSLTK